MELRSTFCNITPLLEIKINSVATRFISPRAEDRILFVNVRFYCVLFMGTISSKRCKIY